MANTIVPKDLHPQSRFAIVVSRYNEDITGNLLIGSIETLTEAGIDEDQIDIVWVPGAWELPLIAKKMADSQRYAAVICLGCVIRGETTHDRQINRFVSLAVGELSLKYDIPVVFGVLTCNSRRQAIHRSGGDVGNKGHEVAKAAIDMVRLLDTIS